MEEHDNCFEQAFVENDGGQGVLIIIPKLAGIDDTLRHFYQDYAEPAPELKAA